MMKKTLLYTALILFNTALFSQEFKREKYNFNSDWKLKAGNSKNAESPAFNDNSWKKVTLPYAYNQEEAFEKDIEHLTTGIVWYCKKFKLSKGIKNNKVFIEFEGINQAGVIYINGQKIGLHENGVMAFRFDESQIKNEFDTPKTAILEVIIEDLEGNQKAVFSVDKTLIRPNET